MKRDDFLETVSFVGTIVLLLAIVVVSISVFINAITTIKAKQSTEITKVYQIDTIKVQVLYEDTWGKILFVKEE